MPETDDSKIKDRKDAIQGIKEALLQCDYDKARNEKQLHLIEDDDFYSLIEKCYYELIKSKEYSKAIDLCETFDLGFQKIQEAASQQYRDYLSQGKYEQAINWGMDYQLPLNELQQSAMRAFENFIASGKITKAIDIKDRFKLPKESISNLTINAFNKTFGIGSYEIAAQLGREFNLSKKRTTVAAVKALTNMMNKTRFDKIVQYEKWYNIFSDSAFELLSEKDINAFVTAFVDNFIKSYLNDNNINYLREVINDINLLKGRFNNPFIVKLLNSMFLELTNKHNQYLFERNIPEALSMKEDFELLDDLNTSELKNTIIDTAQQVNRELIEEEDFKQALRIKNEYRLYDFNIIQNSLDFANNVSIIMLKKGFDKGDLQLVNSVIHDYKMSIGFVREEAVKYIPTLIKNGKYSETFEVIEKLKINTSDSVLQDLGHSIFEKSFRAKKYELASNIALHFNIEDADALKAAFFAWQRKMQRYEFDEALRLKKKFKLSAKATQDVAKEIYKKLSNENRKDEAKKIKKTYRISLSFFDWIKDLFGI